MNSDPAPSFPAFVGHTHLFPGAEIHIVASADEWLGLDAIELRIAFADGVEIDSTLTVRNSQPVSLATPAFTTKRGAQIAGRIWAVAAVVATEHGCTIKLGQRDT